MELKFFIHQPTILHLPNNDCLRLTVHFTFHNKNVTIKERRDLSGKILSSTIYNGNIVAKQTNMLTTLPALDVVESIAIEIKE